MTLHLLSFKSPETQYFEKQMDANEKLNSIKHNEIQIQLNELRSKDLSFAKNEQNTVYNNKKIINMSMKSYMLKIHMQIN